MQYRSREQQPLFHSISKRFNKKQSYYIVKLPCIPRFNNT